jgi:hypothetical protein
MSNNLKNVGTLLQNQLVFNRQNDWDHWTTDPSRNYLSISSNQKLIYFKADWLIADLDLCLGTLCLLLVRNPLIMEKKEPVLDDSTLRQK